ncbi:hypothetical protein SAURM35S_05755 [Streptomyces aurantiogriseus]
MWPDSGRGAPQLQTATKGVFQRQPVAQCQQMGLGIVAGHRQFQLRSLRIRLVLQL